MALNAIYKKEEFEGAVDEQFRGLYTERDGQYEFTGVAGMKTQADIDRISEGLRKEREDHTKTKGQLAPFLATGWKIDEVQAKLDRFDELELAVQNAGKLDDEKINQIVESRIKTRIAPVEREKTQLAEKVTELTDQVKSYEHKDRTRRLHDDVRKARVAAKVIDTAEEDVLFLAERVFQETEDGRFVTKEGVGITPGLEPHVWLTEMQSKRPHWWPESQGGGAKGGRGGGDMIKNPWAKDSFNLTEQGRIVRENPERAKQLAALAGITLQ